MPPTIDVPSDLTAAPCSTWATLDQFVCNEKTRCGGNPCPDGYVSPWSEESWLEFASSVLYNITGRRFSICERTITPTVDCGCSVLSFVDTCSTCSRCGAYPRIDLGGEVAGITKVTIDGVDIDQSLYRVDDHRWLVRVANPDGTNPGWDRNHRYDVNTGPDTFTITYSTGTATPPGAAQACVALACALRQMDASQGNVGPRAGTTVTSVNTRGISSQVEGLLKGLRTGKSGIGIVDVFLATWLVRQEDEQGRNIAPGGAVWSPELEDDAPKRTTWRW